MCQILVAFFWGVILLIWRQWGDISSFGHAKGGGKAVVIIGGQFARRAGAT